jgi:uncharacterized protein YfaP (DUF2135 family)
MKKFRISALVITWLISILWWTVYAQLNSAQFQVSTIDSSQFSQNDIFAMQCDDLDTRYLYEGQYWIYVNYFENTFNKKEFILQNRFEIRHQGTPV